MRVNIRILKYICLLFKCIWGAGVGYASRCHSASQPFEGKTVELAGRRPGFEFEARDGALDVPRRSKPHFEQNIGSSIYALHRRPISLILERNYI
jgi:hypothetical protein